MNTDQSLADGAAGAALLYLETGNWPAAREALRRATAAGVSIADGASLFYGAPALAFALASTDHPGLARAKAITADGTVTVTRQRLDAAHRRIDRHEQPHFAEYDLIRGLTGLGVALRRLGHHEMLRQVLDYLVRLTEPVNGLPGWWCCNSPERTQPPPAGGHGNLGMAHGITGPLALLALTLRDGTTVNGHTGAITRICQWLDTWQQHTNGTTWWPQTVTLTDLSRGAPAQRAPLRPSWCYGTPGIARALQLAGIALGDTARQQHAETALAACLTDTHLDRLTDAGICHGIAGVYQTAYRAAADAHTPAISQRLPAVAAALTRHARQPPAAPGLLTGTAGVQLAAVTAQSVTAQSAVPPRSGWDTCLLIT
jgi:hypothetical protein